MEGKATTGQKAERKDPIQSPVAGMFFGSRNNFHFITGRRWLMRGQRFKISANRIACNTNCPTYSITCNELRFFLSISRTICSYHR